MYNDELFSEGIHSVLLIDWRLRCETPLAIRNGEALAYTDSGDSKTRSQNLHLYWELPREKQFKVAALHYGYEVEENKVTAYHFVPPSSVRGALRAWTIRHLVHPDFLGSLTPPPQEEAEQTEKYVQNLLSALQKRSNGYELIASLFGLAADTQPTRELPSNAGRLGIEADKILNAHLRAVDVGGSPMHSDNGPENINRHMTVRNPLDRITHASKKGGLHHFLEFCRGQEFKLRLIIRNPQNSDIGLLYFWRQDIDLGLLRLGALASIGRGRVSIQEQSYTLWQRPNVPLMTGIEHFQAPSDDNSTEPGEILAGFWSCYVLPQASLVKFRPYLEEHV